ncbi:MAG: hypothetical protein FGM61_12455 [Sediminibacterium sp.]|nr:hypothetical protein [Sediminibacterium sp.]
MKFLVATLLTAYLGYAIGVYTQMPWWSFALSSAVVALCIRQTLFSTFVAGFLGMFLLWAVLAFIRDISNDHILSQRVASLLKLGTSSTLLIFISGAVGGLVSGFAAVTGYQLRRSAKVILSFNLE